MVRSWLHTIKERVSPAVIGCTLFAIDLHVYTKLAMRRLMRWLVSRYILACVCLSRQTSGVISARCGVVDVTEHMRYFYTYDKERTATSLFLFLRPFDLHMSQITIFWYHPDGMHVSIIDTEGGPERYTGRELADDSIDLMRIPSAQIYDWWFTRPSTLSS
jgi:hypothetical protein